MSNGVIRLVRRSLRGPALPVVDLIDDMFPERRASLSGVKAMLMVGCLPFFRRQRPPVTADEARLLEAYTLIFLTTRADRMHPIQSGADRKRWRTAMETLGITWRAAWWAVPPFPAMVKWSFGYRSIGEALFKNLYESLGDSPFYRGFLVYAKYRYFGFRRTRWAGFVGPFTHGDTVAVGTEEHARLPVGIAGFTFSQVSCVTLVSIGDAGAMLHHYKYSKETADLVSAKNWDILDKENPDRIYAVVSENSGSQILLEKLATASSKPKVYFFEKPETAMMSIAARMTDRDRLEVRINRTSPCEGLGRLGAMRVMPSSPDGFEPVWSLWPPVMSTHP